MMEDDEEPSEIEQDQMLKQNMMIHIEGDDNILEDEDEDAQLDLQMKEFLDELKKVGPNSKQILNYSYPPLLYQRGDDEDDEEEDDGLPDFAAELDEEEDKDIQELIKGSSKQP